MKAIEEKAKAYDEAIEYAHYLINERCKEGTDGSFHRADLQKMFPTLVESEEERIRKEIIDYFVKDVGLYPGEDRKEHKWLRWLEKQGELTDILDDVILDSNEDGLIADTIKAKGEQKPANKVEPKFKVGDKIKLAKEPKYPAREIIAIKNDAYYFDEFVHLPFSRQDEWELVGQRPVIEIKSAKERALEKYPIEMYKEVGWRCVDKNTHKMQYFIEGYHQAEKDLELTWEDMRELYIIFAEVDTEIELCKTDIKSETIGYYQEVLKRFKDLKK